MTVVTAVTAVSGATRAAAGRRRRPELAAFLRGRRARIAPEDVGLPPAPRRRTPGLRREEVAQLSGVGVTWYTWLEQGRPINASAQVLDAVARTLRLDAAEREHLYRLAEVPYVPEPGRDTSARVPEEVRTVLDALDPMPAVIYSARYDVLAYNEAYWWLFLHAMAAAGRLPEGETNALWVMFTQDTERCPVVHRTAELQLMVATLRGAYGSHVGEPAWEGFIRRLSEASAEFRQMWASGDVAPPGPRVKVFRYPGVGEMRLRSVSLTVHGLPEARMVVYTADDEASRERVAALHAAGPPDRAACRTGLGNGAGPR